MAKRKKTKQTKATKKSKGESSYNVDQFEDLNGWLDFYKKNGRFPHDRIVCGVCHGGFASLKGLGWKKAFERCDNDAFRVLNETRCKDCREKLPKEKKNKILTPEEMEARAEEIRKNLPKIDFNRERHVIDLRKDKEACAQYTQFACVRPDIYLDNDRTCDYCSINKHCACPIKKFSKAFLKKIK
jgi:hypothetical protein